VGNDHQGNVCTATAKLGKRQDAIHELVIAAEIRDPDSSMSTKLLPPVSAYGDSWRQLLLPWQYRPSHGQLSMSILVCFVHTGIGARVGGRDWAEVFNSPFLMF
jgi:hypothetical protein